MGTTPGIKADDLTMTSDFGFPVGATAVPKGSSLMESVFPLILLWNTLAVLNGASKMSKGKMRELTF